MKVVGIDPGARTALVLIEADSQDLDTWRWRSTEICAPSSRKALSHAENKAGLYFSVLEALQFWDVDQIALEEPLNAATHWGAQRGGRKEGRTISRETLFSMGEHYGLVLAACIAHQQKCMNERQTVPKVTSYPPTDHGKRPGWMGGGPGRITPRALTLASMALLGKSIKMTEPWLTDEDALMALGVARFHLHLTLSAGK